jgi:hypothetical protein
MRSFLLKAAFLLLLSGSPLVAGWGCLSDDDAQEIVNKSMIFIKHDDIEEARTVAENLFAHNITQYSDSINALRGTPV